MYYQNLLVLFITHNTLNQRYFFSFSSLSIDRNIKKLFFIGKCFFFKLLLVIKFKIRIGTKNKSTTSTFIFFTHNSTLYSDIKFINFSKVSVACLLFSELIADFTFSFSFAVRCQDNEILFSACSLRLKVTTSTGKSIAGIITENISSWL